MSVLADYEAHMRRRNFSAATIRRRRSVLRGLERWIDGGSLLDVDTATIELYLDTRASKNSPRTRHHYLSDICCFFDWAISHGHIDTTRNPGRLISRPRLARLLPRPISEEDLAYALERTEPMMRAWLTLQAYAGLRCVEVSRLNADDVLWHEQALRVLGKGNRERLVDMHDLVRQELTRFEIPRHGPVFERPLGGRWPANHISARISDFFVDLGIPATAHQLRHRFGTKLYEQCRDIRVVQEAMGHSSPNTTAIYVRFSRTAMRSAVRSLPSPTLQAGHERSRTSSRAARSLS